MVSIKKLAVINWILELICLLVVLFFNNLFFLQIMLNYDLFYLYLFSMKLFFNFKTVQIFNILPFRIIKTNTFDYFISYFLLKNTFLIFHWQFFIFLVYFSFLSILLSLLLIYDDLRVENVKINIWTFIYSIFTLGIYNYSSIFTQKLDLMLVCKELLTEKNLSQMFVWM